jgi:hypothetical protein
MLFGHSLNSNLIANQDDKQYYPKPFEKKMGERIGTKNDALPTP